MNELSRLPLWKACLDSMREEGLSYGKTFTSEFFEGKLKCERDSMSFGLSLHQIRRELEEDGFYLSGRGFKGTQFLILPPESNRDVMASYQRQALDALKRGVILGTNTRVDLLPPADKKKHEAMLEKLATRAALMSRSRLIAKAILKHSPDLLAEKSEE